MTSGFGFLLTLGCFYVLFVIFKLFLGLLTGGAGGGATFVPSNDMPVINPANGEFMIGPDFDAKGNLYGTDFTSISTPDPFSNDY